MKRHWGIALGLAAIFPAMATPAAAQSNLDDKIDSNIADWVGTYKYLHEHPELSTQEKETSALVAGQLKKMGYEVADHFGQYQDGKPAYGVVALLDSVST